MRILRQIAILFVLVCAGAAPALALTPLIPHRAVYDLALDRASDRSGITGLSGRMVYEFNGSPCEGYTVKFRFVTQIDTSENSKVTDQQTTTFEEGNGSAFSFLTKSFTDQTLDRELRGKASMSTDGLKVEIEKPEKNEFDLKKTQFPTQHLVELIGKANKGETFYETNLFDGSDDADKVMTTTVIVGKKAAAAAPTDPELPALKTQSAQSYWPVDIAYFDEENDGGEEIPQYRISFKLHENGVTRDLVMDYGDFSMTGKLVDLSMFDAPKPCSQ